MRTLVNAMLANAYQPRDFYLNGVVWDREKDEPRKTASRDLRQLVLAFAVNAVVENLQQLTAGPQPAEERNLGRMHLASLHSVIQQLLPSMQVDWPRGAVDLQQALVRVEQEIRTNGQTVPSRPPVMDTEPNATVADNVCAGVVYACKCYENEKIVCETDSGHCYQDAGGKCHCKDAET